MLYAGADGYPKSVSYDQRQFKTIKGKVTTVNSLGGNWTPSSTYGEEVNKLYKDLLNGSWYYLKDSGNMATGWVTLMELHII